MREFDSWAILELMGHRRLGGRVREVELFGSKMCRIDIPQPEGCPEFVQYYGGSAIYCVTPCTEETARSMAEPWRSPDYHPQLTSGLDDYDAESVISEPAHEPTETGLDVPENGASREEW